MLRISKLTDYGIVLLAHMVSKPQHRPHNARELASTTGLPLPMTNKILKTLTRAGILDSQRGSRGGYLLAQPAAEISVAGIIHALEGPIAITECLDRPNEAGKPRRCMIERFCPVRGNWNQINNVIHAALSNLKLAEMSKPMDLRSKAVRMGGGGSAAVRDAGPR